jgi:hypothetical protein
VNKEATIRKAQGRRLRLAREAAGYRSAREAALESGWPESTYRAHESGTRTIGQDDAERYARRFRAAGAKVTGQAILYGDWAKEYARQAEVEPATVPLVGYVGAAAQAFFFSDQGEIDRITAPRDATEDTVAVEIRGDSLGSFYDRWLVFYDDVRRPVTMDLVGFLCVVGTDDGRILIKKLQRSRTRGLFHLLSQTEAPILDVRVEWAAKVKDMRPR